MHHVVYEAKDVPLKRLHVESSLYDVLGSAYCSPSHAIKFGMERRRPLLPGIWIMLFLALQRTS